MALLIDFYRLLLFTNAVPDLTGQIDVSHGKQAGIDIVVGPLCHCEQGTLRLEDPYGHEGFPRLSCGAAGREDRPVPGAARCFRSCTEHGQPDRVRRGKDCMRRFLLTSLFSLRLHIAHG